MSSDKTKPKGAADSAIKADHYVPDEDRFHWSGLAGLTVEQLDDPDAEDLFTDEDLAEIFGKGE